MVAFLTCNRRCQVRTSVVTPTIPSDSSGFYSVVPNNTFPIDYSITIIFPSISGVATTRLAQVASKNKNANNYQVVDMHTRLTANDVLSSVVKYTTNTSTIGSIWASLHNRNLRRLQYRLNTRSLVVTVSFIPNVCGLLHTATSSEHLYERGRLLNVQK